MTAITFPNEIITKVRQGTNKLWYATLDDGPYHNVGDADFVGCGDTKEQAVARCAKNIRDDIAGVGKYAPHPNVSGYYLTRLVQYWETKKKGVPHATQS